ncbi:hypothetical protein GDO78_012226 [Eleutherodactylus coqui]|uniref:UDP-glucuronosyltransferase n=1 Tax=Eleutherodactylus coqui TaxID=57060 RepID=A0A8J6F2V6_ELECQ|nr:hypothetical protein GDO78_012226 [Eleutherodactylus coqui]
MLIAQIFLTGTVFCGNVLIWPTEASHWLNVKTIIDELIKRNHSVTVLVSTGTAYISANAKSHSEHYEYYKVSYGKKEMLSIIDQFVKLWMYEKPNMTFFQFYERFSKLVSDVNLMIKENCNSVLRNPDLMAKLKSNQYNIMISDPVTMCGDLIAVTLDIPFIYSLRFTPASAAERYCGKLPSVPSYTPAFLSELTDRMSFSERISNIISYLVQDYIFYSLWGEWDSYYSDILGKATGLSYTRRSHYIKPTENKARALENQQKILRTCRQSPALDMEKIAQSSGEHGMIVFSLGSMVKNVTDERSNVIAAALSQLPQKVIWRYSGKIPSTLGKNTTKAFITHGGTNGIYEAIYHGVPMVGIPLFADQPDNIIHMKTKGMAVMLDINKMQSQDLVDAVNTVINDPSYKDNALRISQIHHDQPVKPLDRAVFWIEFVMRHKGAKHLRPAAHDLTWYQYHLLDVIGFLLVCLFIIIYIIMKIFSFCCRKCRPAKRKQKKH